MIMMAGPSSRRGETAPRERRDPFPWYQMMRRDAPVYYDARDGCWNIFRYDDVQRVLQDHATFSSNLARAASHDPHDPIQASMIATDPPRHQRLRSLVSKAFTPRAIAALEPRIAAITDE